MSKKLLIAITLLNFFSLPSRASLFSNFDELTNAIQLAFAPERINEPLEYDITGPQFKNILNEAGNQGVDVPEVLFTLADDLNRFHIRIDKKIHRIDSSLILKMPFRYSLENSGLSDITAPSQSNYALIFLDGLVRIFASEDSLENTLKLHLKTPIGALRLRSIDLDFNQTETIAGSASFGLFENLVSVDEKFRLQFPEDGSSPRIQNGIDVGVTLRKNFVLLLSGAALFFVHH